MTRPPTSLLSRTMTRASLVRGLLLVLGVASGALLALLSRVLIAVGSRARARRAERRLRAAVAEVAQGLVVDPVDAELAAHRQTFEGLRRARG